VALRIYSRRRSGAPRATSIDIGTRVQSIPDRREAQTFETIEKIESAVRMERSQGQNNPTVVPKFGDQSLYLKGVANNLKPGDVILIDGDEREKDSAANDGIFRRLTKVSIR
jgi:hypothetical protein